MVEVGVLRFDEDSLVPTVGDRVVTARVHLPLLWFTTDSGLRNQRSNRLPSSIIRIYEYINVISGDIGDGWADTDTDKEPQCLSDVFVGNRWTVRFSGLV